MRRRDDEGTGPRRSPDDDVALVAALVAGDPDAVSLLYDRHAEPLYRLAACLVGPAAAEAVVCDVLVQACRSPGAPAPGNSLRTELLVRTAKRCRREAVAA